MQHEFVNQPKVSFKKTLSSIPHPLDQLSSHEIDVAREAIFTARGKCLILFRAIFTQEPAKAELVPFLEAEHSGTLTSSTTRPARQAIVQYDVVHDDKSHDYMESVVDILAQQEVVHHVIDKKHQSSLTLYVPHKSLLVSRLISVERNSKHSKTLASIRLCTSRPFPSLTSQKASR
jgi:Cu2+-containing amine oxidase